LALHIKKGDLVEVIAGDDKGVRGKVLTVYLASGRVVVEGVNRVFKHVRPSRTNPQGGRLQKEKSIHASNVLPVHPKTNRPTRVRFVTDDKGQKKRVATDGTVIDILKR